MKLIQVAFRYLKTHPLLTVAAILSIAAESFFEGASFGMLIPLVQSMTTGTANILGKVPLLDRLGLFLSSMGQKKAITLIFAVIFLLLLIKNVFVYLSQALSSKLRFDIINSLRVKLMDRLLEYDCKFFDGVKTGHIIANVNIETQRMGDFIWSVLRFVAISGRVVSYMAVLLLISWKASIAVSFLVATVLIPIELIMKKVKKTGGRISRAVSEHNYKLSEILNGIRLIKATGTEELEKRNFAIVSEEASESQLAGNLYSHMIIPLSEVAIFGLIITCFLALLRVGKIDIAAAFPFVAAYLLVLGRTLTQLNALNNSRSVALNNLAAFGNYEELCEEKGKRAMKDGTGKIERFSDSIVFDRVAFSYNPGRPVLRDVNIRIPKGRITALVGASGAGKSTVVNLIARFYDIDLGRILVDETDLKELALKEWRRKIGFVSQDIFIFNVSVKDNIAYGHEGITEDEVIRAARAANCHDFITNLPRGYDTVLGERGVKLSGGQRQRISIARAIIHNPEILILDEATSSLDTETERLITEAINRLTKDRTVIAIAHRLSTILHADNIIVLDKGRVIENGNHQALLGRDGLYKRLYETQFNVQR